ncbi:MAG: glycosyltransferase family 4 protein [Candidatus Caldarchaeum sp.]|nr:glycosyltransferase family 4 protein [Candidatus Caldarchaeum sp.]
MSGRADVLLISPTASGLGGVARHVSELAFHLKAAGYSVDLISSENTPIVKVKGLKNPSFMITSSLSAAFRKASVVHAHNVPSSFAMKTAAAERKILTIHGVYAEQVNLLHGSAVGRVASFIEKKAVEWADIVTVVSEKAAEAYRRMGVEAVYIPNAVDVRLDDVEKVRTASKQVVYVGRLSREKNVGAIVEAARHLKDVVFVIVGEGPEKKSLQRAAEGLDNVLFAGGVEHRKALGYIAGSDVLVLPSFAEGMSTVLLEAMSLKTPVVASAVGGNTEIIQHGVTGLLFQPDDVQQLVESVAKLFADPEYAGRLAENAYRKAVEHFSWKTVFPLYLKVYGFG